MNLIIHKYKPYKKWRAYLTIGFFTYIKYDTMDMLDRAAKKMDTLMYTNPMKDVLKQRSVQRNGNKSVRKKV